MFSILLFWAQELIDDIWFTLPSTTSTPDRNPFDRIVTSGNRVQDCYSMNGVFF